MTPEEASRYRAALDCVDRVVTGSRKAERGARDLHGLLRSEGDETYGGSALAMATALEEHAKLAEEVRAGIERELREAGEL